MIKKCFFRFFGLNLLYNNYIVHAEISGMRAICNWSLNSVQSHLKPPSKSYKTFFKV